MINAIANYCCDEHCMPGFRFIDFAQKTSSNLITKRFTARDDNSHADLFLEISNYRTYDEDQEDNEEGVNTPE